MRTLVQGAEAVLLVLCVMLGSQRAFSAVTIDQVLAETDWSDAEKQRIRDGRCVSSDIRSTPDGSLTLAISFLVKSSPDEISKQVLAGKVFDTDPLAKASGEAGNPTWGPLMRAGYDKSLFARQVERYADVYTSRVSNFLAATPFAYLRAARSSLPHDPA
jgi:hypothetical protein